MEHKPHPNESPLDTFGASEMSVVIATRQTMEQQQGRSDPLMNADDRGGVVVSDNRKRKRQGETGGEAASSLREASQPRINNNNSGVPSNMILPNGKLCNAFLELDGLSLCVLLTVFLVRNHPSQGMERLWQYK